MDLMVDVLPPGRCYACMLADVSCCCFSMADVIAIFLLAGVIAIVFIWWQMLLPLWLLFLPLVGILYHFVADVIAILLADVIAMLCCCVCGRCYGHYG